MCKQNKYVARSVKLTDPISTDLILNSTDSQIQVIRGNSKRQKHVLAHGIV